ncbi:hypothetical protein MMC19_002139 [Ptychographa xylographoides]|nr:hypothetical protein [Ptychographa xylographoides]
MDTPISSDPKRRRFGNDAYIPRGDNNPTTHSYLQRRRESLPRPEFMLKDQSAMTATSRPAHSQGNNPYVSHDSSLTLPPLKTNSVSEASAQAKSVEAMVKTIPTINKIKVLSKICPPLAPPGPTSPTQPTRGAAIAVEGTDEEAVNAVISHLTELFSKDDTRSLRIWESPSFVSARDHKPTFADYLQLITHWHSISAEVVKHITTIPSPPSPVPLSPKTTTEVMDIDTEPFPVPVTSRTPHNPYLNNLGILPIAIIPRYQLTLTDVAASSIPITDSYAPVDHWQWFATLWRGIVGPDITIVVRSANVGYETRSANGVGSPKEDHLGRGGVEVRLVDARAILLRCDSRGKVSESGLRRVGFEVGEYVRGMGV